MRVKVFGSVEQAVYPGRRRMHFHVLENVWICYFILKRRIHSMKKLEMPKVELVYFDSADIICASLECEGQQPGS